jgi:hypothetical protein
MRTLLAEPYPPGFDSSNGLAHQAERVRPSATTKTFLPSGATEVDVGGMVIATPSALRAEPATNALERGTPDFFQTSYEQTVEEIISA